MKTKHHRRPKSKGGDATDIILVDSECHKAWHKLFYNFDPEKIAEIINSTWLDERFSLICVPREKEIKAIKHLKQLT